MPGGQIFILALEITSVKESKEWVFCAFFFFLKQMVVEKTKEKNDCRLEGNLKTNDSQTGTNFKRLNCCSCGLNEMGVEMIFTYP